MNYLKFLQFVCFGYCHSLQYGNFIHS